MRRTGLKKPRWQKGSVLGRAPLESIGFEGQRRRGIDLGVLDGKRLLVLVEMKNELHAGGGVQATEPHFLHYSTGWTRGTNFSPVHTFIAASWWRLLGLT